MVDADKTISWLKDICKWCLIPIAIFLLFKQVFTKLICTYLVEPVFSKISPSSIYYDILILILVAFIFFLLHFKISKLKSFPTKLIYIHLIAGAIYIFYRVTNLDFLFTSFQTLSSVKLLDAIFSIPLVAFIYNKVFVLISNRNRKKESTDLLKGFSVDDATNLDSENDLFYRLPLINEIADRIRNTNSINGSFPIGLVSKWGTGKSTFLNSLIKELKKDDYIIIDFNVWKCGNTSQIIETLFKMLKSKLSPYSLTINNKLQTYTVSLLKGTKNENLNGMKNLVELFTKDDSIELQYDNLNKEVKKIGKKIIIVIDDIDRLDKKEIYEVIRLVRNSANFVNTFFIVAYDRNYILNAIQEINPYQVHTFLEKIFQVEFTLPPISQRTIQLEISKKLLEFLTVKGKEGYKIIMERDTGLLGYDVADLTSIYIINMRDGIRFVNSLKLTYTFIKDEIYFPDFYNLELIRFKHPELFIEIYNHTDKFLTTENSKRNNYSSEPFVYSLAKSKGTDGKEIFNKFELEDFLFNNKNTYKIDDAEVNRIFIAYNSIFSSNSYYSSRSNKFDSHLSVKIPSMYERYFRLNIQGKLSEITFSNERQKSTEEFKKWLLLSSIDIVLVNDIAERFEAIMEFDSKEDFEKIIYGIFYFANLPHPKDNSFNFISFNQLALCKLLGRERNLIYYDGSKENYREFLFGLFTVNNSEYGYKQSFVKFLLKQGLYDIEDYIPKEEISQILFLNFKSVLTASKQFTWGLYWYFADCIFRVEKPEGGGTFTITYPIQPKARVLLRTFIFEKGLDDYLLITLNKQQNRKGIFYTLQGTTPLIFISDAIFIRLLKKCNCQSKYKEEYIQFYEALTTNPEYGRHGVPKSFFKVIPVEL